MSYKESYAKAKKEESLEQLTATYLEFKKPGVSVVGRFIHQNKVPGKRPDTEYNQYLFETDEGLVKFAMGNVTDNEAGALMRIGEIYHIEFKGTEDLGGGRRVNKFFIERLMEHDMGRVGGPGDEPF